MKLLSFILLIFFSCSIVALDVKPESSTLTFRAYQFKRIPTNGQFNDYNIDLDWPKSVKVVINAQSINTKNKTRDRHLRSKDFFDVKKYSTIVFQSDSIMSLLDTRNHSKYMVKGQLTIKDVTKEISFEIIKSTESNSVNFKGEFRINRFDYNLTHSKRLIDNPVDIKIDINCQKEESKT